MRYALIAFLFACASVPTRGTESVLVAVDNAQREDARLFINGASYGIVEAYAGRTIPVPVSSLVESRCIRAVFRLEISRRAYGDQACLVSGAQGFRLQLDAEHHVWAVPQ